MKGFRFARLLGLALVGFVAYAADAPLAAEGQRVFAASCSIGYCHGVDGGAGKGPRLRDRTWSRGYLYKTIEEGIPGSSMPAWKGRLSEHSIDAVIAYVLSVGKERDKEQNGAAAATEALEPAVSLDAAAGKVLFFDLARDGNCGVCHRIGESGTAVAQPFGGFAGLSERDIVRRILSVPQGVRDVEVTTADGERVCGVKAAKGDGRLRIYALGRDLKTDGPPVLRTFELASIKKLGRCAGLNVHGENSRWYTREELESIAGFLKAAGQGLTGEAKGSGGR